SSFPSRIRFCCFIYASATIAMSSLSLHDALPICPAVLAISYKWSNWFVESNFYPVPIIRFLLLFLSHFIPPLNVAKIKEGTLLRSEEHTSELQSRFDLVCRLPLEKKKTERTSTLK